MYIGIPNFTDGMVSFFLLLVFLSEVAHENPIPTEALQLRICHQMKPMKMEPGDWKDCILQYGSMMPQY